MENGSKRAENNVLGVFGGGEHDPAIRFERYRIPDLIQGEYGSFRANTRKHGKRLKTSLKQRFRGSRGRGTRSQYSF